MGSLFQVESGKVGSSECTKLSVDERLVDPDPDMFGYRTFVALDYGEKSLASRKLLKALGASRPETIMHIPVQMPSSYTVKTNEQ